MKRQQLLNLLNNYHPTNTQEQESKKQIVTFINQYQDCFECSLQIGHITSSGWLLNKEKTKALLMHHTKIDMWASSLEAIAMANQMY